MSTAAKLSVLAAEDQLFPDHNGFDIKGIKNALAYNKKKKGKKIRGASTISQQVAKNVFLWQGRSWFRKGLEVYFTFLIELTWGKKRILEVYLNEAEMGKGTFGIEAAAKKYFNKKITAQTHDKLSVWLKTNISDKQYRLLIGYIDPKTKEKFSGYLLTNAKAYKALEYIWNSIYQLKVAMAKQLEPQIQGFEQYTGGQKAGEGFVFNSPTVGLIKLVNRGVFGAAHFNK
jgi:hypothetical protein